MSIELPNRDLVEQLHANIQDLKHRYPNRWQSMLESLANDPLVNPQQLAKSQDSQIPNFKPEQVEALALRALEGR